MPSALWTSGPRVETAAAEVAEPPLAGTVADAGGHGIAGAEIRALPLYQRSAAGPGGLHPRELHTVVVARSGRDGGFVLDGLRATFGYELRVGCRGYAPQWTQVPSLDPAAAVLSGRVAARAGRVPVAGAMVLVYAADGEGLFAFLQTDADGRFEKVVESGRSWKLQVSAVGFPELQSTIAVEAPGREVQFFFEPAAGAP
jgi:hypothetical protein